MQVCPTSPPVGSICIVLSVALSFVLYILCILCCGEKAADVGATVVSFIPWMEHRLFFYANHLDFNKKSPASNHPAAPPMEIVI